jgi:curved DNA-binding protein CbpA
VSPPDPYAVLGVAPDADLATIRAAWKRLARETHPDRHPGDPEAERRFKDAAAAWSILSDPAARARYDRSRNPGADLSDPDVAALRQHARAVSEAVAEVHEVLFRVVLPAYLARYERGQGAELAWRLLADLDDLSFLDLPQRHRETGVGPKARAASLSQELGIRVDLRVRRDLDGRPRIAELTLVRERGLAFAAITVWAGSLLVLDKRTPEELATAILPALGVEVVRYLESRLPRPMRVLAWRARTGRDGFPDDLSAARRADTRHVVLGGIRVGLGAVAVAVAGWALLWAATGRLPWPF